MSLHAYHGVYAALMACLNQQLHICVHERNRHRNRRTIWQNKIRILTELFDHAEDIVPTTTIQPRAVVTEFIDDLEHVSAC